LRFHSSRFHSSFLSQPKFVPRPKASGLGGRKRNMDNRYANLRRWEHKA
jgi:hypothetical protein